MSAPDALMREAAVARYVLDHPGHHDGATAAGYIASLRVQRRVDPHAIPTQDVTVRAAMRNVDIAAVEQWLDQVWGDIAGTVADLEGAA